jgi:hypothetical protein
LLGPVQPLIEKRDDFEWGRVAGAWILLDSCCLYVFYDYYYHISSYSLRSKFLYRAYFQKKKKKTNRCHYFNFIHISTNLYIFRAYRPILKKIHTAVHTTIGSVAVPLGPRALYVVWARGPNSTATEPMDVWTAVWILLKMGL